MEKLIVDGRLDYAVTLRTLACQRRISRKAYARCRWRSRSSRRRSSCSNATLYHFFSRLYACNGRSTACRQPGSLIIRNVNSEILPPERGSSHFPGAALRGLLRWCPHFEMVCSTIHVRQTNGCKRDAAGRLRHPSSAKSISSTSTPGKEVWRSAVPRESLPHGRAHPLGRVFRTAR